LFTITSWPSGLQTRRVSAITRSGSGVTDTRYIATDIYWHTGVLAGHFAYLAVIPESRIGGVALTSRQRDCDPLGGWLARRAAAIFGETRGD